MVVFQFGPRTAILSCPLTAVILGTDVAVVPIVLPDHAYKP